MNTVRQLLGYGLVCLRNTAQSPRFGVLSVFKTTSNWVGFLIPRMLIHGLVIPTLRLTRYVWPSQWSLPSRYGRAARNPLCNPAPSEAEQYSERGISVDEAGWHLGHWGLFYALLLYLEPHEYIRCSRAACSHGTFLEKLASECETVFIIEHCTQTTP